MARKSGFVRRNNVMRRETSWIGIAAGNHTIVSANGALLLTGFSAAQLALRPFTIVRTHLSYNLRSDQRAVIEGYQGAIAMAVVSDQAHAIGVTAVPTPFTDVGSDLWYFYSAMAGQISVTSDIGALEAGHNVVVDSKAMRKVEDGQDIAIVLEASGVSNGWTMIKLGRMLIKLH